MKSRSNDISETTKYLTNKSVRAEFEEINFLHPMQFKEKLKEIKRNFNNAIDGLLLVNQSLVKHGVEGAHFSKMQSPLKDFFSPETFIGKQTAKSEPFMSTNQIQTLFP